MKPIDASAIDERREFSASDPQSGAHGREAKNHF